MSSTNEKVYIQSMDVWLIVMRLYGDPVQQMHKTDVHFDPWKQSDGYIWIRINLKFFDNRVTINTFHLTGGLPISALTREGMAGWR